MTIRHGPAQSVTVRQGNAPIRVTGGRLVIEHCRRGCRRGERLEVEIVTPRLASASVSDGGLLRVLGRFPGQAALAASVADGGALDLRALPARQVTASVAQGGIILVAPGERLTASVRQGGRISYLGDARRSFRRSEGGGVIGRGRAAEPGPAFAPRHRLGAIVAVPFRFAAAMLRGVIRKGGDHAQSRSRCAGRGHCTADLSVPAASKEREDYNRYYDRDGNYSGPTWRGNDGRKYCRKRDGTTGLVVGAVAGAVVGRAIDGGRNRATGTIIGGVAGALVGREIERSAQPLPVAAGLSVPRLRRAMGLAGG